MADVQNFGAVRLTKRVVGKTLGDVAGFLVTDASDALEVHVTDMPPIVVSVPPVTVGDVSVIQKTTPWVVAGDVSTTIAFPASAQVFVNNPASLPVPVAFSGAVSVTGQVSVQNFPTQVSVTQGTSPWNVGGNVSVTNLVAVAFLGNVCVVNAAGTSLQVQGNVSVTNQVTVSVAGNVTVQGNVSVAGNVSIANTSLAPAIVRFASPQAITFASTVSVTQDTSPWVVAGNVSATVAGVVSVKGDVSVSPVAGTSFQVQGAVSVQNFPTVVSVTQGTSPWVVGGDVCIAFGTVAVGGNVCVTPAHVAITPLSPTHVSVNSNSCLAVAGNVNRRGLILTNKNQTSLAGIPIYLGLATVAVIGSGITLYPNGGTFVMDEWSFMTGSVAAVASAAGVASLAIQEFSL
jgi:hypothetical protein